MRLSAIDARCEREHPWVRLVIDDPVQRACAHGGREEAAVGFLNTVRKVWQEESRHYVHGWIPSDPPAEPLEEGEGKYYLHVRCAGMSLKFSRDRFTDRSAVLQSVIRWPTRGEPIVISQTIDQSRFTPASDGGADAFDVFEVTDKALSGDLPLNTGNVDVDIAVLAAPESSLLKQATSFLTEIASLTMIPQLTAAAPVAAKLVVGVDTLLGNEDVKGVLALSTSVAANEPRSGYYAVTDLVSDSVDAEQHLRVKDRRLQQYSRERQEWEPATGFSYLLLEIRVKGSKPTRWQELPEIVELGEAALSRLSGARSEQDIRDAWPQMHLAVLKAVYSQDLAHVDRDLAAQALTDQWKQEVQRLGEIGTSAPRESDDVGEVREEPATVVAAPPPAPAPESARPPLDPAALAAAQNLSQELDDVVHRIQVEEVDVQARDIAGTVKGIAATSTSWVKAGTLKLVAENVREGASVTVIEVK